MAFGTGRQRGGSKATTPAVDFVEPVVEPAAPSQDENVAAEAQPETKANQAEANTEGTEGTVTVTDVVEPATDAKPESAETKAKRGARPPINVGNVLVRKSTRTDFRTRTTPTDNHPIFLAVKGAAHEDPTDILIENDEKKIAGAISLLRRSGTKLKIGMSIAPKPYPTEEQDGVEYAVLTFKTHAEQQDRGKKKTGEGDQADAPVAPSEPEPSLY